MKTEKLIGSGNMLFYYSLIEFNIFIFLVIE
jgi:hypothetical protein